MIILDTNVISELARVDPEPEVVTWLDSQPAAEIAITAITAAELLYGVARLPEGPALSRACGNYQCADQRGFPRSRAAFRRPSR